jgi:hypothetical protein
MCTCTPDLLRCTYVHEFDLIEFVTYTFFTTYKIRVLSLPRPPRWCSPCPVATSATATRRSSITEAAAQLRAVQQRTLVRPRRGFTIHINAIQ